ncbi:MAG: ADOP family duplicated permease [Gemmatimonadota bacterium]
MSFLQAFRHRLRRLLRPGAVDRERAEEFRFHLSLEEQQLTHDGQAADAARLSAKRAFGSSTYYVEEARLMGRNAIIAEIGQSLRQAIRGLKRDPLFAAIAVITLGLGIGATATMFRIIDRLLLRAAPHVEDAGRLVRLFAERRTAEGERQTGSEFNLADLEDLRRATRSFARVASYQNGYEWALARDGETTRLDGAIATHDFLPMLGVRPLLGRFFDASEDRPQGGARVVVISGRLWTGRLGSAPNIMGQPIAIGGRAYTVVGVLPPDFTGVDLSPVDVWMPMGPWSADAGTLGGKPWHLARGWSGIYIVGRLRPSAVPAPAADEATRAWHQGTDGTEAADSTVRFRLGSVIAARGLDGPAPEARIALWLGGVTLLVLLIAVSNVANLLLSRAARRRREFAVRLALGSSRARLARQLVTESLLLALGGAVVAVAVAIWGAEAVRLVLLPQVATLDHWFDPRIFAVATATAVGAGIVVGIGPLLTPDRVGLAEALRSSIGDGPARSRARSGLVLIQTALTVVLLAGAGLFVHSLHGVRSLDLGLLPNRVLIASAQYSRDPTHIERLAGMREALARVTALPFVRSAALAGSVPFRSSVGGLAVRVPGQDSIVWTGGGPFLNGISPGYFATVGTTLVRGRDFAAADGAGAAPVVIVNQTMARRLFRGGEALGRCFLIEQAPACRTVVGVVRDSRVHRFNETAQPQAFVPLEQWTDFPHWPQALFVRVAGDAPGLERTLQRTMTAAIPGIVTAAVVPWATLLEPQVRPYRLGAAMFAIFGGVALVIAAVGLYGVLAYSVARRQREMGVRLALGARPGRLVRLVLGEGLRSALLGIAVGVAVVMAAGRFVAPLLFATSPYEPAVLAATVATLLVAATLAGLIPAWRATRVDPTVTLREE